MRKMKKETKKTILRVIVLIMAAALLLSVIIIPLSALNVSAEENTGSNSHLQYYISELYQGSHCAKYQGHVTA